ncbi:hypothetical protein SDC9_188293 [bioreactor metagenome]|uniref:HTH cro/C1-type domain-containing protein n=1 Tax=bioreactor metagenome TaxID=1076179 RepID=A0A645HX34_9ZZZZ
MTKLKLKRIELKWKLRQVAELLNVTPQTVQQMERHGVRKPVTAKRYAAALSCKPEEILEFD